MSKVCDRKYLKEGAYTAKIIDGISCCTSCGNPIDDHKSPYDSKQPDADTIFKLLKLKTIHPHSGNVGDGFSGFVRIDEESIAEAKASLLSALLSKMPKKRGSGDKEWIYTQEEADAYNQALDEVEKILREYFGDKS